MFGIGKMVLLDFLERIKGDAVIDARHISLFMALYRRWVLNDCRNPILVKSRIIMEEAKISSSATYFDKLRYLDDQGYIDYDPSFYCRRRSRVSIGEKASELIVDVD